MMRWLPLALVLACGGGKSPAESVAPEVIDTGDTTTPIDTAEPVTPSSFEVKGIVVDREGTPVPDAIVMVGGREETMTSTAEDGSFSIWYEAREGDQGALVAGKIGYRSVGATFLKPGEDETIMIRKVNPPDNHDYIFQDPGDGENVSREPPPQSGC